MSPRLLNLKKKILLAIRFDKLKSNVMGQGRINYDNLQVYEKKNECLCNIYVDDFTISFSLTRLWSQYTYTLGRDKNQFKKFITQILPNENQGFSKNLLS